MKSRESCAWGRRLAGAAEFVRQLARHLLDLIAPHQPGVVDGAQHVVEARHPAAGRRREVGAAVERLQVGREEDRHRPTAAAGHHLRGVHVDLIEIGPLLAIDLDRDEPLVDDHRDLLVFEALVLHHMAPVTGGVADREKDRPLLALGALERLRAPRMPVDGIVFVLEQVGRRFVGEMIWHVSDNQSE